MCGYMECTLFDPMQVTAHNVCKHVRQSGDGQLKSDLVQNKLMGTSKSSTQGSAHQLSLKVQ